MPSSLSALKCASNCNLPLSPYMLDESKGLAPGDPARMAWLATLLGCQGIDEFRAMVPAALEMGVTPVEVKEIVYQAVAYLGIGRVFPFLKVTNEVLEACGVELPLESQATTTVGSRREAGTQAQVDIFGEDMKAMARSIEGMASIMLLREYLQAKGYSAELYPDGEAGYKAFLKNKYDLCVFDVMMPKKDGFTLAQEVRAANAEIPIIFLTAKTLKDDILEGFKIGADDYLTKPFSMEELTFRIEAILRRVRGKKNKESNVYKIGKFIFDTQKQILSIDGKQTKLTTKESELLGLLCAHGLVQGSQGFQNPDKQEPLISYFVL